MTARRLTTIREEIRQGRPFRTSGSEVTVALERTADLVRRSFARVIEPAGITGQQYNVLRILRGAEPQGLPTLDIAERMIEQAPGITRLVDRLADRGLVTRVRDREDRRVVTCRISKAGLGLLASLDGVVDQTDARVVSGLKASERRTLLTLLDRVRVGMRRSEPSSSSDRGTP